MTTQPTEAVANDANAPVDAKADALNTFEEIAAATLGEDEEPAEEVEEDGEQPEPEATEEAEIDEEDIEPELPAIDPPNSLTAEEKEQFKSLPREAQEFTARRIGELEKGLHTKAQEAAQAKRTAQYEALQVAEQIKAQAAEQLQRYAQQFEVKAPDAVLMDPQSPHYNPSAYAQQLQYFQHYSAQREQAQRDADSARAEQAQIQAARAEHEAEMFRQQLGAELPEIFDPSTGQQLAQELNATAELLGFDPNEISDVSAIKALKLTSEWKRKADQYDALNKKKMERVRAGKAPPPISKPGTARTPDQNKQARAEAAAQTMQTARTRAERDSAAAVWLESQGYL